MAYELKITKLSWQNHCDFRWLANFRRVGCVGKQKTAKNALTNVKCQNQNHQKTEIQKHENVKSPI